ncbi:MAG: adenylosuccinate synthase [Acidobacteria bacterium]|nr:MAG: adenylosuccinate synthase [Acidobacteriota bacterium]
MKTARGIVVVGVQWGDEGKGKVVDALAEHFDIVARYQGGANAGHTVVIDDRKFVFQLLPSGILRPDKIAVIGNGVVVDLEALVGELDTMAKAGIDAAPRLRVSDRAHLILPYHRSHEVAAEQARGGAKIGTTAKGIGPTYEDKAGRRGLRTSDLRDSERFRQKCLAVFEEKNRLASALFPGSVISKEAMTGRCLELAPRVVPALTDTSAFLNGEMDRGKRVLFEGAQGTLLDLDHGTYPYVTSSSAAAGGASTGTGVGPTRIGAVVGVTKAYTTRVGSGPFPTEVSGPEGEKLRERGSEYGAVTGRPRRCGWFDVPAVRYSARLNDLRALLITKLDILDHLAEIPVGVEYEVEGRRLDGFPAEIEVLESIRVRYKNLPGWQQSTFGLRNYSELPSRAQDYLRFLSDAVGVEIAMISTGPGREQTIWDERSCGASLFAAR